MYHFGTADAIGFDGNVRVRLRTSSKGTQAAVSTAANQQKYRQLRRCNQNQLYLQLPVNEIQRSSYHFGFDTTK